MYRVSTPYAVSDPCNILEQRYSCLEDAFNFIADYNRSAHNAEVLCYEAFQKSTRDILINGSESEQDTLWGLIEEGLLLDTDEIFYFEPSIIMDYIQEDQEPIVAPV